MIQNVVYNEQLLFTIHAAVEESRKHLHGSNNYTEALRPAWLAFWKSRKNGDSLTMTAFWGWYNALPKVTNVQ